jgi:hypothetical protein
MKLSIAGGIIATRLRVLAIRLLACQLDGCSSVSSGQRAADRLAVAVKLGRNYRPKETIDNHF